MVHTTLMQVPGNKDMKSNKFKDIFLPMMGILVLGTMLALAFNLVRPTGALTLFPKDESLVNPIEEVPLEIALELLDRGSTTL